jgi:hypothetical protein
MTLVETTSSLTNILIRVLCDQKTSLELTASAADLIATGARLNAAFAWAKWHETGKPRDYFERLAAAYATANAALRRAWEERERTDDMNGVAEAIRTSLCELQAAMAS